MKVADIRGLSLNGATQDSADAFDQILDDLYHYRLKVPDAVDGLISSHPGFLLAHVLKGYMVMTEAMKSKIALASEHLDKATALSKDASRREKLHIEALRCWIEGDLDKRFDAWESILSEWPLDLLAYRQLTGTLFWAGDKRRQLNAAAQLVGHWKEDTPGYGLFIGPLAFAMEEMGQYETAEKYARTALEINSSDLWSLHALAHVLEMQGRVREGDDTLTAASGVLNNYNLFRGHLWWHLGLFRFAQGKFQEVLDLIDNEIYPASSSFYLDVQNGASILARLEFQGVDVGDRWRRLAEASLNSATEHTIWFTGPHHAMNLAHTGKSNELSKMIQELQIDAKNGSHQAWLAAEISIAVQDYHRGDYQSVLTRMMPMRYEQASLGASHAQQDVFYQYLVMAALNVGKLELVRTLLKERISVRVRNESEWQNYRMLADRIDNIDNASDVAMYLRHGL